MRTSLFAPLIALLIATPQSFAESACAEAYRQANIAYNKKFPDLESAKKDSTFVFWTGAAVYAICAGLGSTLAKNLLPAAICAVPAGAIAGPAYAYGHKVDQQINQLTPLSEPSHVYLLYDAIYRGELSEPAVQSFYQNLRADTDELKAKANKTLLDAMNSGKLCKDGEATASFQDAENLVNDSLTSN